MLIDRRHVSPVARRGKRRPGVVVVALLFGLLASACSRGGDEPRQEMGLASASSGRVIDARQVRANPREALPLQQRVERACPASQIPVQEIEGTTLTYPPGAMFDGPTEIFLSDGRYLLITTGGREEGRYRLCGQQLCVRVADEAERCRTLERLAPARYLSHRQTLTFTPLQ